MVSALTEPGRGNHVPVLDGARVLPVPPGAYCVLVCRTAALPDERMRIGRFTLTAGAGETRHKQTQILRRSSWRRK